MLLLLLVRLLQSTQRYLEITPLYLHKRSGVEGMRANSQSACNNLATLLRTQLKGVVNWLVSLSCPQLCVHGIQACNYRRVAWCGEQ